MKELVIISGKGGTGKTSITASFAALAGGAVLADCDVDAADLELLLEPKTLEKNDFMSGQVALIDQSLCTVCGKCFEHCRFEAVMHPTNRYEIDPLGCEGCGVCEFVCTAGAVIMKDNICGEWRVSSTKHGTLVHAALRPGSENSGKLVSFVRTKAKEIAANSNAGLVIIDGPPGTGCPVIASIGGVSFALVVTEPTLSGMHDLERVLGLARHFKVPAAVCINKYDINEEISDQIEGFCSRNGIPLAGKVSYDPDVTTAMLKGVSTVEFSNGAAALQIRAVWQKLSDMLLK